MELETEAEVSNRRMELEIEKEVRLKRLHLEAAAVRGTPLPGPDRSLSADSSAAAGGFDVGRNVGLVTQFREAEVDSYFSAFERVATSLKWPDGKSPGGFICTLF